MFSLTSDRRKITVLAGIAGALLVLFFALHPLARTVARSAARSRGWQLHSQSVRFGLRGVWLRQVQVQSALLPELRARLGAVLIPWSGMVGSARLAAYGGDVHLPADWQMLRERLSDSGPETNSPEKRRWQVRISGVTVRWRSNADQSHVTTWGLSGEASNRTGELSADRVEAESRGASSVLTQLRASLKRSQGRWVLENVEVAKARVVVHGGSADDHEPRSTANAERTASAGDGIERIAAGFARLEQHTQRLRRAVEQRLAPAATAAVRQLDVRWQYREQKLDIGPLRARVRHAGQTTEWTVEQDGADAARRFLQLRVPDRPSRIELEADMGAVSLQTLGVKENDLGLRSVANSRLAMALKLAIDELAGTAEWQARGEVAELGLLQPWLAPRPVEGIQAAFSGKGNLKWRPEFLLDVQNLSASVGRVRMELTARLQRKSDETSANIDLEVPLAACEDLIEALPRGLAPLASQVHLDGTLSLQSGVRFDTARPSAAEVRWKLANACRVKSVDASISPERFRGPFILEVPDEHKSFVQRAFGPGTADWVAFADMTSHLSNAVLVCEDGGFFRHGGFDGQAIRNSIRENLVKGRFARGASTVSMQLAKNLYLRREKTFSRKLQEAVLTLLLEQSFTKNELMELYLNVVELGPGVYGVREAARLYFNTTPAMLSPLQAYYLVSLLPNPKVLHFEKDGRLSPGWLKLLRHLMTIANKRHYLSDDELKVALQEDLRFGVADTRAGFMDTALPSLDEAGMVDTHDAIEQ